MANDMDGNGSWRDGEGGEQKGYRKIRNAIERDLLVPCVA